MDERAQGITSGLPPELDALPRLAGFRLRGLSMTRLETFIDAAFAFAITMLVIATQQIPDDIETLLAAFKNVPAFVASIIVLIYIYPLKAIFSSMWFFAQRRSRRSCTWRAF